MLDINYFGMTFVVDKATNVVLHSLKSNEIAKFVVSSILDTAAVQQAPFLTNQVNPDWFTNKFWIKHLGGGKFEEFTGIITPELIKKREVALLRTRGYYLLLEQVTILGCSYDNLSDLNSYDLPMFYLNKDLYIREYSRSMNIPYDISSKHLNFLADSLLSAHLRKQSLLWKYSNTLKAVNTEDDLREWRETVIRETVGLGQV